ncbi:hypothetical protein GCM10029964_051710 [Kibdelosporangium lantanae]
MRRLGYDRYVAQGGDVGAGVTDAIGRLGPDGLVGIHTNLLVPALNDPAALPNDSDAEQAALAAIKTFQTSGNGYFVEMSTRPQTIGYALLDSPVALAAWMIDHDTDAYYKIARAFVDDEPSGGLTRDHVLDNITAYWLSGTGASAARSYWEAYGPDAPAAGSAPSQRPGSRSGSARSQARSGGHRAAGPKRPTPRWTTSVRPNEAATSRPGRNRNCSRRNCERPSVRCAALGPEPFRRADTA